MAAAALVLAACSAAPDDEPGPGAGSEPSASHSTGHEGTASPEPVALRPGERFLELAMPERYTPSAPNGGTDDYLTSGNVIAGAPKVYIALSKLLAPFTADL